jgi:hypothetical protein
VVGIELDRGLLVSALVAAGYQVVAVNLLQASRYRKRHGTSGAKSDRGDAKVLTDLVRTDRHNHRPVAGRATWPRPSGCWLGPSVGHLEPSTPAQQPAVGAAGLLPGSPGRIRGRQLIDPPKKPRMSPGFGSQHTLSGCLRPIEVG